MLQGRLNEGVVAAISVAFYPSVIGVGVANVVVSLLHAPEV